MTSQKQFLANLQNAQFSTGPITIEGKAIVAQNATKHGIFTKDLIITSGAGQEDGEEYEELLNNLSECLSPRNQIESLLVEKIAVDFWRLRRTLRFETGSIQKHIERMIVSYYSGGRSDNDAIDRKIGFAEEQIEWNMAYLKCLKKNEVTFDKPIWEGKTVTSDISEDFYRIARSLRDLTREERELLHADERSFEVLSILIARHGYSKDEQITTCLIEIYETENARLKREIKELNQEKELNQVTDSRNAMLGFVPNEENAEKVMKYERSIQKSIFQNIFLLKKLQEAF